jgi:hypothetical protein
MIAVRRRAALDAGVSVDALPSYAMFLSSCRSTNALSFVYQPPAGALELHWGQDKDQAASGSRWIQEQHHERTSQSKMEAETWRNTKSSIWTVTSNVTSTAIVSGSNFCLWPVPNASGPALQSAK